MKKRLELKLTAEIYEKLNSFRKENNYLDNQDVIYELLREKFSNKKSFFDKLKDLFR